MKNLRTIKSSFIIVMMLASIFFAFNISSSRLNTASAALIPKFVQYDSVIELSFVDSSVLNTPIHPLGGIRSVDINLRYYTTVPDIFRSGPGKTLMFGLFKFQFLAPVHLTVENIPEWCTATITPSDIIFDAFGEGTGLERTLTLTININKESTALFPATLNLKATGESPDPHIKAPPQVTLDVPVTPGYIPLISTDPGQQIKETSPGEPVTWNIKITNNGNGEAIVKAHVINPPQGWVITVNPQTIVPSLAESDNNVNTISLTALPPKNFGIYNDQMQIELELIPEFSSPGSGSSNTTGDPVYLTLGVQTRGFSGGSGAELGLIIIVIIVIIIIMLLYLKKKKK